MKISTSNCGVLRSTIICFETSNTCEDLSRHLRYVVFVNFELSQDFVDNCCDHMEHDFEKRESLSNLRGAYTLLSKSFVEWTLVWKHLSTTSSAELNSISWLGSNTYVWL